MGIGEITTRAGRYVAQPAGYRAFLPAPLPPVHRFASLSLNRVTDHAHRAFMNF